MNSLRVRFNWKSFLVFKNIIFGLVVPTEWISETCTAAWWTYNSLYVRLYIGTSQRQSLRRLACFNMQTEFSLKINSFTNIMIYCSHGQFFIIVIDNYNGVQHEKKYVFNVHCPRIIAIELCTVWHNCQSYRISISENGSYLLRWIAFIIIRIFIILIFCLREENYCYN